MRKTYYLFLVILIAAFLLPLNSLAADWLSCDHMQSGINCELDWLVGGACLTTAEGNAANTACGANAKLNCNGSCVCNSGYIRCGATCKTPMTNSACDTAHQSTDPCTGTCGACLPGFSGSPCSLPPAPAILWSSSGNNIYNNFSSFPGNVGIGTKTPGAKLDIVTLAQNPAGSPLACPSGTGWIDFNLNTIKNNGECFVPTLTTSGGNVGIGTASPSKALEVSIRYIGDGITVSNSSTTANYSPSYTLKGHSTITSLDHEANIGLALSNGHYSTNAPAGTFVIRNKDKDIMFSTQSVGAYPVTMTVSSGGKVGIGTTTPVTKLEVNDLMRVTKALSSNPTWPSAGQGLELAYDSDINRGYIQVFDRATSSWGELYLGDGKVGIGTTAPAGKLTIRNPGSDSIVLEDTANDGSRPGIQFTNNDLMVIHGDDSSNENFHFYSTFSNTRTNDAVLGIHGDTGGTTSWGKTLTLTHDGSDGIIATDTGDLLLLPSSSRVGIGPSATNPTELLSIRWDAHDAYMSVDSGLNGGNSSGYRWREAGTQKWGLIYETWRGDADERLVLVNGTSGSPYDLMTFRENNVVTIWDNTGGATAADWPRDGTFRLQIGGQAHATAWSTASDTRIKKDVHVINGALDKVMGLKGVSFKYRNDEYPNLQFDDNIHIGFIAQDVEKVIPELVINSNTPNGLKSLDYGRFTPLLVEAIKEQQKQINDLKAQLNTLSSNLSK